jgi:predicted DsbA family dithiol-disulfide isomerase
MFMKVEIWSDVVCPWCYIGKRNLEEALARFDHRDGVEVVWRSFELDPGAPRRREGEYAERLARKYGVGRPEAQAMVDRMTSRAAEAGLTFRFDLAQPGNTFDAHRLIHLGRERGVQDAVKERLLAATFTEGAPIGERDALVKLGAEAGLDPDEARLVLEGDRYGAEVRGDEEAALDLGVTGVPFFLVDGKFAVPGAQPPELLLRVLDRAWSERRPVEVVSGPDGGEAAPGCEGDACAL